ncbi:helix-turn-helix domain-containing protein [Cupriavidus campinensis]
MRSIDFLYRALAINKQKDVAERIGVSEQVISSWKSRGHVPPEQALKLADLTGDDLLLATTVAALEQIKDEGQQNKLVKAIARVREGFLWPLNALNGGVSLAR